MTKRRAMISDLKSRTLSLFRRSSASSTRSSTSSVHSFTNEPQPDPKLARRKRPSSTRSKSSFQLPRSLHGTVSETVQEEDEPLPQPQLPNTPGTASTGEAQSEHLQFDPSSRSNPISSPLPLPTPDPSPFNPPDTRDEPQAPTLNVQEPSPERQATAGSSTATEKPLRTGGVGTDGPGDAREGSIRNIKLDLGTKPRPLSAGRRSLLESRPRSPLYQSFVANQAGLDTEGTGAGKGDSKHQPSRDQEPQDYFSATPIASIHPRSPSQIMAHSPRSYPYAQQQQQQQPRKRKVWVKRPGASATVVVINEDDMVDEARDYILKKYANSLGRSFDSPDVTLRIRPREQPHSSSRGSANAQLTPSPLHDERALRPDEILCRTLDVYFPGQQSIEEALIIDVPQPVTIPRSRRTPRHSPGVYTSAHHSAYSAHLEDMRPSESDKDYFPPAPMVLTQGANGAPSPRILGSLPVVGPNGHPHSIAVLNGAQLPSLPSPGSTERAALDGGKRRHGDHRRPKYGRQHTSSPTIVQTSSGHVSEPRPSIASATMPQAPSLPTPPHAKPPPIVPAAASGTPPPRVSSPRPKPKRAKKASMSGIGTVATATPSAGLLASVPPINVLIVEDNIINLKLLEAFLKRLKVRNHSAMNGRDAVNKWREGGFHLVLMDIQLPVMNGLEATKEIRRLERVNGVGAFVKTAEEEKAEKGQKRHAEAEGKDIAAEVKPEDDDKDKEENRIGRRELFKSPVIIVALTASSLHSDRSEALAAGCNDFLTKPVNLTWLERKLKEWGCMQALIDFDGWRQWKDFQSPAAPTSSAKKALTAAQKAPTAASAPAAAATPPVPPNTSHGPPADAAASVPSSTNTEAVASGATAPPTIVAPAFSHNNAALQDLNAKTDSTDSTTTLDSLTSTDSAESVDTAMPSRRNNATPLAMRGISPVPPLPQPVQSVQQQQQRGQGQGPWVNLQTPTPQQSLDGGMPQMGNATAGGLQAGTTSIARREEETVAPAGSIGNPPSSVTGGTLTRAAASGGSSRPTSPELRDALVMPGSPRSVASFGEGVGGGDAAASRERDKNRESAARRRSKRSSMGHGQAGGLSAVEEREGESDGKGKVEVGV